MDSRRTLAASKGPNIKLPRSGSATRQGVSPAAKGRGTNHIAQARSASADKNRLQARENRLFQGGTQPSKDVKARKTLTSSHSSGNLLPSTAIPSTKSYLPQGADAASQKALNDRSIARANYIRALHMYHHVKKLAEKKVEEELKGQMLEIWEANNSLMDKIEAKACIIQTMERISKLNEILNKENEFWSEYIKLRNEVDADFQRLLNILGDNKATRTVKIPRSQNSNQIKEDLEKLPSLSSEEIERSRMIRELVENLQRLRDKIASTESLDAECKQSVAQLESYLHKLSQYQKLADSLDLKTK